MQPGLLALIITLLPLLTSHAVYLLSAYTEFVPWCIPYIDGCTSISRAARSGNSIFIFRASMIAYGVLLIWFWIYARHWLQQLYGQTTSVANRICWLGIVAAISLIIYVDFLGTTGEVNRFMRRYGIMVFFTLTPLAQLLLLQQHYKILPSMPASRLNPGMLHYQLVILLLMLAIGVISVILDISHSKTDINENIVEWNFSLLLNMYFLAMIFIWKDYRYYLKNDAANKSNLG